MSAPLDGRRRDSGPTAPAPTTKHANGLVTCLEMNALLTNNPAVIEAWRFTRDLHDAHSSGPGATPPKPSIRQAPEQIGEHLVCVRGSDIAPRCVEWLWPGFLARGKLHLIAGPAGTGKTTIALALAAVVTCGGQWPDGTRACSGDVLIWSAEDDIADTLLPRLLAAGADGSRVHFIQGVVDKDGRYPFDPSRDVPALAEKLAMLPDVRMILIDPIVSAVCGDSHKNAEVRRGLAPLVDAAALHGCALIGVTHFSKGTSGRDPVERVTGSLAFGAMARVVYAVIKQPAEGDRPERRLLLRSKSNIGPDGDGFAYDLHQAPVPGKTGMEASRVGWREAVAGSARELLAEAEDISGERTATDDAKEWLAYRLEAGPVPATTVLKSARLAGISEKSLRTAREKLEVKPAKDGFSGGWIWALPKTSKMPVDAQGAQKKWLASSASSAPHGHGSRGEKDSDSTSSAKAACVRCDGEGCNHCQPGRRPEV